MDLQWNIYDGVDRLENDVQRIRRLHKSMIFHDVWVLDTGVSHFVLLGPIRILHLHRELLIDQFRAIILQSQQLLFAELSRMSFPWLFPVAYHDNP